MQRTANGQLLAEGELNWVKDERHFDRYGSIHIQTGGKFIRSLKDLLEDAPAEYASFLDAPVGTIGRLLVEVTVARDSYHTGDTFRGITPETPRVGEVIILGEGELFTETYWDVPSIGVRPNDGRTTDWMDPPSLYRAHAQTVKLYFDSEPA